jgi:hypothetical protein
MGKQTMGVPFHTFMHRTDTKAYRLQTGQTPIVKNAWYNHLGIDNYPLGTNAVVAVISYTGLSLSLSVSLFLFLRFSTFCASGRAIVQLSHLLCVILSPLPLPFPSPGQVTIWKTR